MKQRLALVGLVLATAALALVLALWLPEVRLAPRAQAASIVKSEQVCVTTAITPTFHTITSTDGVSFVNDGKIIAYVKNSAASTVAVTVTTPMQFAGLDLADLNVSIPASGERVLGPFNTQAFNYQSGADAGRVVIQSSDITSVTVALLSW